MSNSHTVVSEEGLGSRLGNSFKGILFGAVLILGGIGLLFWNEGNFVKTKQSLEEAEGAVVSLTDISKVDSANQGKVVHLSGDALTQDTLTDAQFAVTQQGIMLQRKVQYYQWTEDSETKTEKQLGGSEKKVTTYTYKEEWVDAPVNSSQFNNSTKYVNTLALPDCRDQAFHASKVTVGAFSLNSSQIKQIGNAKDYVIPEGYQLPVALQNQARRMGNMIYITTPVAANTTTGVAPAGATSSGSTGSTGNTTTMSFDASASSTTTATTGTTGTTVPAPVANAPRNGDMKVTWVAIGPKESISLVAQQQGDTFVAFVAENGREVALLENGVKSSAQLFASAHSSNVMMTWILRLVGFFAIGLGFSMMMAPLAVLADVVPFIGNLVGAATTFAAFVLSFVISSLVIAIAWLYYRPLIGCCILLLTILGVYYLAKMRKKSKAAA